MTLPSAQQLSRSLTLIDAQSAGSESASGNEPSPIFLLSTGWRAGSTLVQRVLVTDPRLLLWGEPLGRMAIVPRLSEMLAVVTRSWPQPDSWIGEAFDSDRIAGTWIANLYPPAGDLRAGLRRWFDQWLGRPALTRGFTRWGVKEVRFSAADAVLLHWLYPRARFVLLSRNPFDCYRSFAAYGTTFYFRWPDAPVASAAEFARHWNRIAVSWTELPEGFPSYRIKYEDVIAGQVDWRALERALDLELKEDRALSVRVGGSSTGTPIRWCERLIIKQEAAAGMGLYGYSDGGAAR